MQNRNAVPPIAAWVADAGESLRPDLVKELVAIECELRTKLGDSPNLGEYLDALPKYVHEATVGFQLWRATFQNSEASSSIPEKVGDFRIVQEVGRGGMGVVYEAVQESLGRRVAIKTLVGDRMLSPSTFKRFEREAQAVAQLHHSNIVVVHGFGIHNDVPYFAMDFIDGVSLSEALRATKSPGDSSQSTDSSGQQPINISAEQEIARLGIQIADALQYAHDQGILHRDVKPSNLIIDGKGVVWVTDFGLAKRLEEDGDATTSGEVVGSLRYLPPEGLKGEWGKLGDVYSLGLTLYELVVSAPAFPESQHFELLDRIRGGAPPVPPRTLRKDLSEDLETIVMKACAFEPESRYQSAGLLADDLRRFLNGEPIRARQASVFERFGKWRRRKPLLAAFCSLVALIIFVGGPLLSFLWLRSERALADANSMQKQLTIAKVVAETSEELAISESYASSMQLAQNYLEQGQVIEVASLLGNWDPTEAEQSPGLENSANTKQRKKDRRGWEWQYLQNQCDTSRLTLMGHSSPHVHFAAIRSDGRQIATVGGSTIAPRAESPPGEVILWNAETGEQQQVLPGSASGVFGCAYSPDGTRIATISMRREESHKLPGEINIWDVDSGELLNSEKLPGNHDKHMHGLFHKAVLPSLLYSQDGKYLISWPMPLEVRNAETLELVWSDDLAHGAVALPNDRLFLSSRTYGDRIVDIHNGEVLEKLPAKPGRRVRFDLAVTASGEKVSASDGQSLLVWNTSPLKARNYSIDSPQLRWGAIHPSGTLLVSADRSGVLKFTDLKKNGSLGTVHRRLGHAALINHGAFSHDGRWMVTTSSDGTAKVWNIYGDRRRSVMNTRANAAIIADLAFSADATRIQYASRRSLGQAPSREQNRTGWQSLHGENEIPPSQKFNLDATYFAHWPRTDFAFSKRGRLLAAPAAEDEKPTLTEIVGLGNSGRVNIWRSENYELLGGFDVGFEMITSILWSDDAAWLVVAGTVGAKAIVKIFPTERFQTGDGADIRKAGNSDESLEAVCEFEVGQPVTCMSWHGPTVSLKHTPRPGVSGKALASSSDATLPAAQTLRPRLATANYDGVEVWELKKEGEQFTAAKQHEFADGGKVAFLDFSPDGKQLAAAVADQNVARVYDMADGELQYEVAGPRAIGCVRFSPDGTRVAMTGYDSVVFLYEAKFGRMLLQLSGSGPPPGTIGINPRVVFSSDGRHIATNNWRGEITVWDAGPAIGE